MVNSFNLLFTAAAILAISAPAFANPDGEVDEISLFAREEDVEVYSRVPEVDVEDTIKLASRSYRSHVHSLKRACKKVKGKDRKQCLKELKSIKKSKKSRKNKSADLKKAVAKWRSFRKSAKQYAKGIHHLQHTCKKSKGTDRKECLKELKAIKKSKKAAKDKNVQITHTISKYKASKMATKEYKKQIHALHAACKKIKKKSDKKACLKEYKAIKKSHDTKDKKLSRTKKTGSKFHVAPVDENRPFDDELEARVFLNELD